MHLENKQLLKINNGFTLAEVLITLVIIGIIAAMTVPAIMQNANESATVSKVKKGLSVLGQAKMLAETQNGPIMDWDLSDSVPTQASADRLWTYLRPHIQIAKDCGVDTSCYQTVATYYLNGANTTYNQGNTPHHHKFVLSDGSVMWFRTSTGKCVGSELGYYNACAIFFYDVNGDKAPNAYGRDIFFYVLTPDGVYPVSPNSNPCTKNSAGYGCSGYIIKNSNMNYLH